MREQQGLAYKDIAESLEATETQVKTWLHRARARLLNMMADDENPKPGQAPAAETGTRRTKKSARRSESVQGDFEVQE